MKSTDFVRAFVGKKVKDNFTEMFGRITTRYGSPKITRNVNVEAFGSI